jgi:hypothetical protein
VEVLEDRSLLSATGVTIPELARVDSMPKPERIDGPAAEFHHQEVSVINSFHELDEIARNSPVSETAGSSWQTDFKTSQQDLTEQARVGDTEYEAFQGFADPAAGGTLSYTVFNSEVRESDLFSSMPTRSDLVSPLSDYSSQVSISAPSFTAGYSSPQIVFLIFEPLAESYTASARDMDLVVQRPNSSSYSVGSFANDSIGPALSALQTSRVSGPVRTELALDYAPASEPAASNSAQPKAIEPAPTNLDRHQGVPAAGQLPSANALVQLTRNIENSILRFEVRDPAALQADAQRIIVHAALPLAGPKSVDVLRDAAADPQLPSEVFGPQPDQTPGRFLSGSGNGEADAKQAAPLLAGLLGDISRMDATAIEQGLQQFLRDFDAIGGQVVQQAAEVGWNAWMAPTIVATAVAMEIARRKVRRTALASAGGRVDDTTWSWFSGVGEPGPEDHP